MNYLIGIQYDGSEYHGWQLQENAKTIQGEITESLKKLFQQEISVNGCSRTDSGVHANCFMANFHSEKSMNTSNVISGMNFFLPQNISVFSAEVVDENFHARFDCKGKEYIYLIYTGTVRNPFYYNRTYFYHRPFNVELLNKNAKDILGQHDFSCFKAEGSNVKSSVRTVSKAYFEKINDNLFAFHIAADGFLYNMVRIIVGTLLYIQENKIPDGSIPAILESKNRTLAGITVPPEGLYLNEVYY